MRWLLFIALFSGFFLSAPPRASATVMVEVPFEDMARDADAIVSGQVLSTEVRIVLDPVRGAVPHTFTRLAVRDWIAGSGGATVVIEELGGEIQGEGLIIAGTPIYRVGEEVIVFLERADGRLRTYAMAQGRFEIRRGVGGAPDHLQRDLSDIAFVRWQGGAMQLEAEHGAQRHDAVSLGSFVAYVRRIANRFGTPTARLSAEVSQ